MTFNEAWPAAQSNHPTSSSFRSTSSFRFIILSSNLHLRLHSRNPININIYIHVSFIQDTEQIYRTDFSQDLHRTGCSLFCGAAGRDNQAVLRRVLLGFARWNKFVGYCQGLNVLAALVLQVMDRAESAAVKVMIYLIEGVLPEGYFADNLRGLSVDMAVFRDLLRARLPKLSKHLEALQNDAKDKATGNQTGCAIVTLFARFARNEATVRGGSSHR